MRKALVLLPLIGAALAGCATMSPQELRAQDAEQCRDYGFRPQTNAFAECLQRIDLDRAEARRDRDREFFRYHRWPRW